MGYLTIVQVGGSTDVPQEKKKKGTLSQRYRQKHTNSHKNLHLYMSCLHTKWRSFLWRSFPLPPYLLPPLSPSVVMQHWRTALGQLLSQSLCTDVTSHAQSSKSSQKFNGSKTFNRKTLKPSESPAMQRRTTNKPKPNAASLIGSPNLK